MTPHFNKKELVCPCCGKEQMSVPFMQLVEAARVIAGVPFVVTSAYRCEDHNQNIGGDSRSAHKKGLAIDIARDNPATDRQIFEALLRVGFIGIEIGSRHFHIDMKPRKHGKKVLWTAESK